MSDPLIIAALMLVGVALAGLVIDVQALLGRDTRAYGASSLCIKGVLGVAVVLELLRWRIAPAGLYADIAADPMFAALVTMSLPLMAVALACEILALPRLASRRAELRSRRAAWPERAD